MSRFKSESVLGANPCRSTYGDCVPKDVHRLDPDLELCVCQACGQGWMRDVDVWQKLDELSERLKISTERLQKCMDNLGKSLQALGNLNGQR
jgi:hypothetical protein